MASLAKLLQQLPEVHAEFFVACRAAEEARIRENQATMVIQKHARGFLTKRRIDLLRQKVICIQKTWRGYLGRQRALRAQAARDKRLRELYFAAMATTVQRHWRGFWSRKYVFDFYARKVYLARVTQVNAKMRALLAEEGERTAHTQKALAHETARAAFDEQISKLHHLLSTHSQPGIFASPYALAAGTVPIIAGAPVEEHLKAAFKLQATTTHPTKRAPKASTLLQRQPEHLERQAASGAGATFLPPIMKSTTSSVGTTGAGVVGSGGVQCSVMTQSQTRSNGTAAAASEQLSSSTEVYMSGLDHVVPKHLTLRQTVPYDAVRAAQALESKVVKAEMMTMHPLPFSNSLRKPEQPSLPVQSNLNLEAYHDPYDPTIGARGETFTPAQQAMSPTRFAKHTTAQAYFDKTLLRSADTLPPKSFYNTSPKAARLLYAAGLTSEDVRRRALKPAR